MIAIDQDLFNEKHQAAMTERKPSRQSGNIAIRVFNAKGSREEAVRQGADIALFDRLTERYGSDGLPQSLFFARPQTNEGSPAQEATHSNADGQAPER